MVRDHFDRELHQLRMDCFQFGTHMGRMLARAVESVVRRDPTIAATVTEDEEAADTMARAIEQRAELLIATQQPVAVDMRQITAALIVAQELERMADHAQDIAGNGRLLADQADAGELVQAVGPIYDKVSEMTRLVMQAYLTNDAAQAGRVAAMDDSVDALYRDYYERVLAAMATDQGMVMRGVLLMHVAYDLERIADRATNICERVSFVATGELPRFNAEANEPVVARG